jgi:hypothetical protein
MARDGVQVYFKCPGPTTRKSQPNIADTFVRELAREKILKLIKHCYLQNIGITVKSTIKWLAVPKGYDDIRLVYDATANWLNECVWVLTFWLPTVDSMARALNKGSWMTDRDVEDMFLNFQLHESVVPYTRVDLLLFYEAGGEDGPRWAVWDRNLMGFSASPYNPIKMLLIVGVICRGD